MFRTALCELQSQLIPFPGTVVNQLRSPESSFPSLT